VSMRPLDTLVLDALAQAPVALVASEEAEGWLVNDPAATLAVAVKSSEVQASGTKAPGGNEVALAVAALRGGAAEQGYATLVEKLGSDVRSAKDEQTTLQGTVTSINDQRQSVSGVSLDEEMTNLISFQRGYQASARTLTAMDSMLETLIEHTGTVGL